MVMKHNKLHSITPPLIEEAIGPVASEDIPEPENALTMT